MSADDMLADAFERLPSGRATERASPAALPADGEADAGEQVIGDLVRFIGTFVVLSEPCLVTVALWVVHTHAIDAAYATPYLNIRSPQRRCGKTRLLELLSLLVARPWFTARTSAAALIRKVSKDHPTLLLDETDAAFASDKEYVEVLRGILNAGNLRGVPVSLCVGREHNVADFDVFGPKALAGIGRLPDTVADRSISIEMKRRLRTEQVQRFRRRDVQAEAEALRGRVECWAYAHIDALKAARPALPEQLSDRAQEGWEPLLAVAELCGIREQATTVAIELSGYEAEPEDLGLRALADVRTLFEDRQRMASREIVDGLRATPDGPYGPMHGRDFDERALAKRLKPFGVRPEQLKIGDRNVRGYDRAALAELWDRYLAPCASPISATTATNATLRENEPRIGSAHGTSSGPIGLRSTEGSGVADVAPLRNGHAEATLTRSSVLCGLCHRLGRGYDDGRGSYVCADCAESRGAKRSIVG